MLRTQWLALLMAATVTIWGCGEDDSTDLTSPPPPATTISAISPTSAVAGTPDLMLTITGANFVGAPHDRSQAVWSVNGDTTLLATTFVSSTQLTTLIPAALLSTPVTASIFVQTGDPMADLPLTRSNPIGFRVERFQTGSTSISAISPTGAVAGSPDLTLTITGANFAGRRHYFSQAMWNANGITSGLATTFVSGTQLTAVVPAALLSNPDTVQVFVETGDPMADIPLEKSNLVNFTITPVGAGAIIVYGQTSTLGPRYKGYREVSLDGSPWRSLREGDLLIYSPVAAGNHQLALSNPCTSTHQPSIEYVTVVAGDTVTVAVYIPPLCE